MSAYDPTTKPTLRDLMRRQPHEITVDYGPPRTQTGSVLPPVPPILITGAGFAGEDRVLDIARQLASLTAEEAAALRKALEKLQ